MSNFIQIPASNIALDNYLSNDNSASGTNVHTIEDAVCQEYYNLDQANLAFTTATPSFVCNKNPNVVLATNKNVVGVNLAEPFSNINDQVEEGYTNYQDDIVNSDYIKDLVNEQEELIDLRSELDEKLKVLYDTDNSIFTEYKYSYDSTIYAGLLWIFLIILVMYIVFMKL
jgi:hypothetical protein